MKKTATNRGREPLVSVLMPCYNTVQFIEEAVRSIMNQTYRNMEIICVDDCSTDGTFEILQKLSDEDKRIKLFRNEHNLKRPGNRNRCISLAGGEYIAWMDSDDVSLPERIATQVAFMETHKYIASCGSEAYVIDKDGNVAYESQMIEDAADIYLALIRSNRVYNPSSFGRTKVFKENLYRDYLAEDYEMWCRLVYTKGLIILNLHDVLIKYRVHAAQVSTARLGEQDASADKIRSEYSAGIAGAIENVFRTHEKKGAYDKACALQMIHILDKSKMTDDTYKRYKQAIVHFIKTRNASALLALLIRPRCAYVFTRTVLGKIRRKLRRK